MRVVVPFTRLSVPAIVAVAESAHRAGLVAEWADVGHDEFAYYRLVRSLWEAGEGFILVEHDIEPGPDTIYRLTACPRRWCAATYPVSPGVIMSSFGCVRFRSGFLRENRRLFESGPLAEPVRWQSLDSTIEPALMARYGHAKHLHERVRHRGMTE